MTSEQHSPTTPPEQPDTHGAVPADGQRAPGDREDPATPGPGDAHSEPAAPAAPTAGARTEPAAAEAPAYREVTVRRAPKFVPFMMLGAILGFLAALVLAYTGPADPTLTRESILGFFTVAFAIPGLILAALLVLVFDRRSVKRAERARAERTYDDGVA
ncbi:hypothetical protein ACX80J_02945 [Arthrobacter sp. MDB2-24]